MRTTGRVHNGYNNYTSFMRRLRVKRIVLGILLLCTVAAVLVVVVARARSSAPQSALPPSESLEGIDIENISQWDPCYITVDYPRTANEQVNAAVKDFVQKKIDAFIEGTQTHRPRRRGTDELAVVLKVTRFDDDIVSFLFHSYTHFAGASSGENGVDSMTFDLDSGKQYDLASLFRISSTQEHLQTLSRLTYEGLKNVTAYTKSEKEAQLLRQGTQPLAENFSCFVLDGSSLRLYFPPMQISSGSGGEFAIPLESLRHLLSRRMLSPRDATQETTTETQPPTTPATQPPPEAPKRDDKLVALTFDDGPHPKHTPQLLDFLQAQGVPVTFFVVGVHAEGTQHVMRRAADEGHQIGSHTYSHKDLTKLDAAQRRKEFNKTADLIERATGERPKALRPPFGAQDETLQACVDVPLLLWSVDPEDWRTRDAEKTYKHVLERVQDGDIILLHDFYAESVEAAKRIIPALKAQGYTFVTVEQLLDARGQAAPGEIVRCRYP